MITLCNSVRAVLVGVLFTPPVGWLEVSRQGLENAENSNCSSSTGVGPTLTTMTKLLAGWPAILTKMSASFSAFVCRTFNLFSGQRRSRILRCLQIVTLFTVISVDSEEYLCIPVVR